MISKKNDAFDEMDPSWLVLLIQQYSYSFLHWLGGLIMTVISMDKYCIILIYDISHSVLVIVCYVPTFVLYDMVSECFLNVASTVTFFVAIIRSLKTKNQSEIILHAWNNLYYWLLEVETPYILILLSEVKQNSYPEHFPFFFLALCMIFSCNSF